MGKRRYREASITLLFCEFSIEIFDSFLTHHIPLWYIVLRSLPWFNDVHKFTEITLVAIETEEKIIEPFKERKYGTVKITIGWHETEKRLGRWKLLTLAIMSKGCHIVESCFEF